MRLFSKLGSYVPQFPFVAYSRGWTAEDMEQNVADVQQSEDLREGTRALVERAVETAGRLLKQKACSDTSFSFGLTSVTIPTGSPASEALGSPPAPEVDLDHVLRAFQEAWSFWTLLS